MNEFVPIQEKLSRLTIQVVCEPGEDAQVLLRHLQRTRAAVAHVWPAPERIGETADLLLCDYGPGLGRRLSWMPGEATAALVLLLPPQAPVDLREVQAACPDAVLNRPFQPRLIDVSVALALDHFTFGKRMRQRVARMDENIRAMRDIEKAKHLIMARDKIGEVDAFRVLRDMAMKRRTTIANFAAKLIDSVENMT